MQSFARHPLGAVERMSVDIQRDARLSMSQQSATVRISTFCAISRLAFVCRRLCAVRFFDISFFPKIILTFKVYLYERLKTAFTKPLFALSERSQILNAFANVFIFIMSFPIVIIYRKRYNIYIVAKILVLYL